MNSERLRATRGLLLSGLMLVHGASSWPLGAPRASAQESANAANDAAYKELIEQALSEFKHKNWPEARVLFVRAHELNPNARTLRGMGIVSFEMRDYLGAVVNLKAALDDQRQALTDAQRKECEGLLTRARTYVGVFTLKVDPADAEVLLDGTAPARDEEGHLLVPFGDHSLTARAAGRQEATTRLVVQGGERGEISLVLQDDAAPVAVATIPSTRPNQPAQPAAVLSTQATGSASEPEPRRFIGGGLKYTWVALGTSAVFGGGAALFWALGKGKLDDLDERCAERAGSSSPCTRGNTSTDSIERYELLTNVSFGVSMVALAATGVLAGLEWPREHNVSVSIGDKSLFLRGAF